MDDKLAINSKVSKEFKIIVLGSMSSGKSTFINSLLGYDLLPYKNEACTSKIITLENVGFLKEFVGFYYNSKNEKSKETVINQTTISEWNDNINIASIRLMGDFVAFDKYHKSKISIIDTPGPNYFNDKTHQKLFNEVIKGDIYGIVCVVLDVSLLNTNDESSMIKNIYKYIKEHNIQNKLVFILNKIDKVDSDKDSITNITYNTVAFLKHDLNIENPLIFPVSSIMAKIFKKILNKSFLSAFELSLLYSNYNYFLNNKYGFNDLISYNGYKLRKNVPMKIKSKGRKFNLYNPFSWVHYKSDDFLINIDGEQYLSLDVYQALKNTGIIYIEELFKINLINKYGKR